MKSERGGSPEAGVVSRARFAIGRLHRAVPCSVWLVHGRHSRLANGSQRPSCFLGKRLPGSFG